MSLYLFTKEYNNYIDISDKLTDILTKYNVK